jgi:hypothetical protein
MNPEEVARECDELHKCIEQGPGENPGVFAQALTSVRRLRAAASWDYPLNILTEVEVQLAHWFSPEKWRGPDDGASCRDNLLCQISRVEDGCNRPRA